MEFNLLAQLLAAASTLVVGFVYYNPKVLGGVWMRSIGLTPDPNVTPNMGKLLGFSFLLAFIATFPLNYMVNHDNHTFGHGALHGGEIGLLILLPVFGTNALYEGRSWTYVFVISGYWTLCFALMGGILRIMQ